MSETPNVHTLRPLVKLSEWRCFLFGMGRDGIVWRPAQDQVPNAFHRWMQNLCFGCKWVKDKPGQSS